MNEKPLLPPQPWMNDRPAQALFTALAEAGGVARFVGGCVRDALARSMTGGHGTVPDQDHAPDHTIDIDIATDLRPQAALAALKQAGFRVVPTGLAHGVFMALKGKRRYEVAGLRQDVATDGRRAVVAWTEDWRVDAARRDFTVNALYADAEGRIDDYFGGIADLRDRRIRFIGDAHRRIAEDRLRVLRFFRFDARFGRDRPDGAALAACRAAAGDLHHLSAERVRDELRRILCGPKPAESMALMRDAGVLAHWLPEVRAPDDLARLVAWETRPPTAKADLPPPGGDWRRRLLAVTGGAGGKAAMAGIARRLVFSRRDREHLRHMVAPAHPFAPGLTAADCRRALHRLGPELCTDLALLGAARCCLPDDTGSRADAWRNMLYRARTWPPSRFPLDGDDALAAGLMPGPELGHMLAALEEWWIGENFRPDKAACIAELRRRLATE